MKSRQSACFVAFWAVGLTILGLSFDLRAQGNEDDGIIDLLFLGDSQREGRGVHFSHVVAPRFNRSLGVEKIRMSYVETTEVLNDEDLAKTDVLMLYANHAEISDSQETALLKFVEEGGGFVPVHCASWCFGNSDVFTKLVGARFKSHGYGEFSVQIAEGMESHPILDGFEGFATTDETYVHSDHNDVGREVLMYRDGEPWTWTREQGKGRVFYTAYGHDENTWNQRAFHDLLIRGILWSVGEKKREANRQLVSTMPEIGYTEANTIPNYLKRVPEPQLAEAFSPEESAQLSLVSQGFELQLFASEPDIVNPVAFAWDEKGRLFVAETIDYPNNLDPNQEGNDRIIICEDKNGDGRADTFTVFADGLNIPTGLTPMDGGWVVAQAPHFLFLKDTDGDDKADLVYPINDYWGIFDTHAGPSNLRYGLDNKIWGAVGYSNVEESTQGEFGQGVFRMDPDSGVVEPIGMFSNNTWGLGISEDFEIFGSTANNAPAWHVPLWRPFTYERNENLPTRLSAKIDDFTQFFPITHNFLQVDAHGRYTAGSGFNIYTARSFPREYWNKAAFEGGPTGHLLGQFFLKEDGSSYIAQNRGNILASVDEWLSPVFTDVGPDGQLWVADWYNFIIQHNPRPSLQSAGFEGTVGAGNAHENPLRDRHHGRIYRIVAKDAKPVEKLDLSNASSSELVAALRNENMFWRTTAQRKLVRERRREAIPELRLILENDTSVDEIGLNTQVIHAIWSLHGLGAFNLSSSEGERSARQALQHPSASVRKNAVMALTETKGVKELRLAAASISDSDPKTRLKGLLALGLLPPSDDLTATLIPNRARLTTDPWLGRAYAYAVLENVDSYAQHILAGSFGNGVDFLANYESLADVPEYIALKVFLSKLNGELAALGDLTDLSASTVGLVSLALLDVWKSQLHEPNAEELSALQKMVSRATADMQMQQRLRTAGLEIEFSKIDEEKYAVFLSENSFEPQVWGWGSPSDGEAIYMQHCVACHGSEATGDYGLSAPSLRGMEGWYVQTQLQKFYAGVRGTHFKNPRGIAMKSALQFLETVPEPNRLISHLGHYLETLSEASPVRTLEGDAERGETWFASCIPCHGTDAEGNRELGASKLTGKQDWYLFKQLVDFREGVRGADSRDTKGAEMANLAKTLPNEQAIADVVAYIQSLNTE